MPAKDPVFCGIGVLFTEFFVAVLLRMTDIRERAVGDAGPCKADPKTGP